MYFNVEISTYSQIIVYKITVTYSVTHFYMQIWKYEKKSNKLVKIDHGHVVGNFIQITAYFYILLNIIRNYGNRNDTCNMLFIYNKSKYSVDQSIFGFDIEYLLLKFMNDIHKDLSLYTLKKTKYIPELEIIVKMYNKSTSLYILEIIFHKI